MLFAVIQSGSKQDVFHQVTVTDVLAYVESDSYSCVWCAGKVSMSDLYKITNWKKKYRYKYRQTSFSSPCLSPLSSLSHTWATGVTQSESTGWFRHAQRLYSRWRWNKGREGKQPHMKENQINRLEIRCSRQIMKGIMKWNNNSDHKSEAGKIRHTRRERLFSRFISFYWLKLMKAVSQCDWLLISDLETNH